MDSSPFDDEFNRLVSRLLSEWHVSGLAIAVVKDAETFTTGYGSAHLGSMTPVTPKTLFCCASTTKAFTAAAISMLVESNELTVPITLDTPIHSILPADFVLSDETATASCTLLDALTHRTGVPAHDLSYGTDTTNNARRITRNLRNLPLTSSPRVKWQYCNMMYSVLTHVVETLTAAPIECFFRKHIWEPLNMTNTSFDLPPYCGPTGSTGYRWSNLTKTFQAVPRYNVLVQGGGVGATVSSVTDYALWLSSLINFAPPLSSKTHKSITTPHMLVDQISPFASLLGSKDDEDEQLPHLPFAGPRAYGLGWNIDTYRSKKIIWHTGGIPGYGTLVAYAPEIKFGVAIMANCVGNDIYPHYVLLFKLLDDILGVPEAERVDVNARCWNAEKRRADKNLNRYADLWPDHEVVLRPSLPLSNYAGTYENDGYGKITVFELVASIKMIGKDTPTNTLYGDAGDRTWIQHFSMVHVVGEFWEVKISKRTGELEMFGRAEFRIGPNGRVSQLGMQLELAMEKKSASKWTDIEESMIWFRRSGPPE